VGRRYEAMNDTVKSLEQAMHEVYILKGASQVVIEMEDDKVQYEKAMIEADQALFKAHEILFRQQWGFLNEQVS
jgi:hypothetical protein